MTRRLLAAIGSVLRDDYMENGVHFHSGPSGRPAVCHDSRCTSPRLQVEDWSRLQVED